jgi:hypothetical protein
MPPDPGFDQEIVLLGPVSTDLAEWDVQTFGANARRFRQHRTEIAFAKGEAAEAGERCLLPKRTVGVLACLVGRGIVRRQMLEDVKVLWKWWRSLPCADDLTHQLEGADNVNGLIGFTETRFPNGFLEGYLSHIARRIQDSRAAREIEARRDISAKAAICQSQIQHRQIGLVTLGENDRLLDGARNSGHFVPAFDENVCEHVGHQQVVFGDYDLEHQLRLSCEMTRRIKSNFASTILLLA